MAFPVRKKHYEQEEDGEFDEEELEKITSNDREEMRKEPRLVDYDGDISQRWYVEYYLYDDRIDEWVRKKYSKRLNKFKTATKRKMEAEKIIKAINLKFAKGYNGWTLKTTSNVFLIISLCFYYKIHHFVISANILKTTWSISKLICVEGYNVFNIISFTVLNQSFGD